jgi:hypothetical protein
LPSTASFFSVDSRKSFPSLDRICVNIKYGKSNKPTIRFLHLVTEEVVDLTLPNISVSWKFNNAFNHISDRCFLIAFSRNVMTEYSVKTFYYLECHLAAKMGNKSGRKPG